MTAQDVADLYAEIQRLQCALNFWLPCIPAKADEVMMERMENDACLLVGFDGPLSNTAEDLGWVTLHPTAPAYTPRDVAQILCDNSPRCDENCTHTSSVPQSTGESNG